MKFSVIIPIYNVEKYVEQCIYSVARQDYPTNDFEIIVVDDCSPDNSIHIVNRLSQSFNNIKIVRHAENKHLGGARNTGIREATGDWILFVDSDDSLASNTVLYSLNKLIQRYGSNIDAIKSNTYTDILSGPDHITTNHSTGKLIEGKEYLVDPNFLCNVWTGCYRRFHLIQRALFFREHIAYEDFDWTTKVFHEAAKVLVIDFPFYAYRLNPESITNSPSIKVFKDNIASGMAVNEYIQSYITDTLCKKACLQRLKKAILSYLKISRNYKLKDSLICMNELKDSGLLQIPDLSKDLFEKIIFLLLHKAPFIPLVAIRCSTLLKRKFIHNK